MFYLFGTAIIIGGAMAYLRLRGQNHPALSLAILHGMFAITGFIWMIVIVTTGTNRTNHVTGPLVVFCVVVLLGIITFTGYHLRKKPLPVPLMLIHGILALIAFCWLLF